MAAQNRTMKTPFCLLLFATLGIGTLPAEDLRGNAFFQALEGTWKGKGHFTNTGQEPQMARNRIVADFQEDGEMFSIKGNLILGEEGGGLSADPMEYRWEFRRSVIEGLYDGRLFVLEGEGDIIDFEVSIDEETLTAQLTQISGISGGNRFELTKTIEGEHYVVGISMYNSDDELAATGELRFSREA